MLEPSTTLSAVDATEAAVEQSSSHAPQTYASYEADYEALRNNAAVIDHAAIGLIEVGGAGAIAFAQAVLARDIEFLTTDRCMMSLIVDEDGTPVDLVNVYGREDGLVIETSFGRGSRTLAYLQDLAPDDVTLSDLSGEHALIGLEGPYAWGIVGRVLREDLMAVSYETIVDIELDSMPAIFARSGFTGEYGYKVIAPRGPALRLWETLASATPSAGYQALETAMLEVRQPVLDRELGPDGTILSCGFNWLVDVTKPEFRGRRAVMKEFEQGPSRLTVGFRTDGPRSAGARVRAAELPIGSVIHTVFSPGVGEYIGLARVAPDFAAAGLDLEIETQPDEWEACRTVCAPFLLPKSWTIPVV